MGIQLPPVPQVTTVANTHHTHHHRNRSLDSALQRIPEVDITPSPECESVVCNDILSTTDAYIVQHHQKHPVPKTQRDELASLGSDDSGILCGSDAGSTDTTATRESSIEFPDSSSETDLRLHKNDGAKTSAMTKTASVPERCQNSEVVNITTTNRVTQVNVISETPKPSTGLLRLLESKVFDVSMAIQYLFKSKESGVQSYIANKMFSFDDAEVDFYLPQLVCMYIQMQDVAEVLHPYLISR